MIIQNRQDITKCMTYSINSYYLNLNNITYKVEFIYVEMNELLTQYLISLYIKDDFEKISKKNHVIICYNFKNRIKNESRSLW